MSKQKVIQRVVTITITDTMPGKVNMTIDFEPAFKKGEEESTAMQIAGRLLNDLSQIGKTTKLVVT